MKYKNTVTIVLLCAVSAGAAFLAGANKQAQPKPAGNPVSEILNLSGDQTQGIAKDDPTFDAEMKKLSENLEGERHKLLELLQAKEANADAVNGQLEKALAADAAMERRVINHLLVMRQHLDTTQSQQLMNLCDQCMCGNKNGKGMGMGMGMGRGMMYRGGRN